ncbi:MAG: aminotransferase class I/II-fold pyridoxal phosphate-dependent enzyme [Planctomycetes bacterium]|nr:aminotransferase class I/II-fold pyridoxal phosphate-dependent enzyme [Planctomycetota bacterium]
MSASAAATSSRFSSFNITRLSSVPDSSVPTMCTSSGISAAARCSSDSVLLDMDTMPTVLLSGRRLRISRYCISDEVYEHMVFDGAAQLSAHCLPELAQRSFIVSSFGKTFHVTGWKLGYCVAPAALTAEFRKLHQYVTFSSFTPAQYAVAAMLKQQPQQVVGLGAFYQCKRDSFAGLLQHSRFKLLPCQGTYFLLADYSAISDMDDVQFCQWLTTEHKVAAIPLSVFYQSPPNARIIRFCFAKQDSTLQAAAELLCQI